MIAWASRDARQPRSTKLSTRARRGAFISGLSVAVLLAAWQLASASGIVDIRYASAPSRIFLAAFAIFTDRRFYYHAAVSLNEFCWGFALALAIGPPIGFALGSSRRFRQFAYPLFMALYMAPVLAPLPILVIWVGIGSGSKIVVVFLSAVFPILVNTAAGVDGADQRLVRVARAFGARRLEIYAKVVAPCALPSILTGVRLAVGRGVLGVIVGEMYVSQAGLGHQLITYGEAMQVDRLFVYAFAVSLFGYSLTSFARLLERRVSSWREQG